MCTRNHRAFTLSQLLVILAFLAVLFALALPAIVKARFAADRRRSENNLKQIGLALHNYHDANGALPPGNDDNNFSALARLLPYIEEIDAYKKIDFMKPMDDKANAAARQTVVKVYLDPADNGKPAKAEYGGTNYLLNAGSKPALADNNGLCYHNSKVKLAQVTDGLSNTMMAGETLRGDGTAKATTVKRQYVLLKKDDLKDITDDTGVKDWKDNKNIAGDRGASWMDGRFLQSTFTGTRTFNDDKPDVNCAGLGGLSGLRSDEASALVLIADGSVRTVKATTKLDVWKALAGRNDGIPLPKDF